MLNLFQNGNKEVDGFGVPEIFEYQAQGKLRIVYHDIQYVLKVPIVNFMFRTLGLYERFLVLSWDQVRPNMLTLNMEKAAEQLRYPSITVGTPQIDWKKYYDHETLARLDKIIFTFNYVNTKLLIIASAWAESLSYRPILGEQAIKGYIEPGVIPGLPHINLVHVNEAPTPIRHLLLDIAKKHHSFDVASDYRALANYPEFLSISWGHLSRFVGSREYEWISSDLTKKAITLAKEELPFPVTINREMLESCYSLREIAGIMGVVSMFQQFLPGLIIDGEFFRRMISNRVNDHAVSE
jgi:hypothetical protein